LGIRIAGWTDSEDLCLGVLSADGTEWIQQRDVTDEFDEEYFVSNVPGQAVSFVWYVSNTTGTDRSLTLDATSICLFETQDEDPSETDLLDTGWSVGYSGAGVVIGVGADVHDLRVGDRVACGGAGLANHAEVVAVPRRLVVRVPAGCSTRLAASTTIGAIALQGVRRSDAKLGETACVIGLGLIGILTCQLLKASGCRVFGIDPDPDRVDRALSLGVDAGTSDPQDFLKLVGHSTLGHGSDFTVITAATKSSSLINEAMKLTRRKGRVVVVGDVGLNLERADLYRKEIDVLISSSYGPGRYDPIYEIQGQDYPYAYVRWTLNRNMEAYLDLLAGGSIDVESLIDETVALADAPETYERLAASSEGSPLGVLIQYPVPHGLTGERAAGVGDDLVMLRGSRAPKPGRLGYALVGAGAFGTSMLVPEFDKFKKKVELRGVVSRDAVRGGNFARQRQIPLVASSLEGVLRDDRIDVVVIATRHHQHSAQVSAALEAEKHVFVEKPLALSWEELESVGVSFESLTVPRVLMVGFNRRFSPAAMVLRERLADRNAPVIINYRVNGGFIPVDSWIQTGEGGGRNLGEACHMYDFFRSIVGAPVATISAESLKGYGTDYLPNDNFVATITYEDGSLATLTYTANGPKQGLEKERIEITCEERGYLVENFERLTEFPSGSVLWSASAPDKGHEHEIEAFVSAVVNGDPPPLAVAEIFEASAVALHIEDLLQGRL
jgi:predicted dehydrogenase/threonine dehydrogenase-like Zn-dependent dehydrogenase